MANTLNKTKNFYKAIGTVSELKLKREPVEIELRDTDGNITGKANTQRIMGTVAVNIGSGVFEFNTYQTEMSSFPNKDGEYKNPRWDMAEAMTEWNPQINGNPNNPPTLVEITGTVAINDYPKEGKIRSGLRWNISKATTSVSNNEKGASAGFVGYIDSIKPEIVREEETGRLKVTLYGVDGKGECFPINCFVEAEMADDFTDAFSVGQTIEADFDIVCSHVGDTKSVAKKQFGRSSSVTLNSGFDKRELIIVGADIIEEPDELTVEDENGNEVPVKTKWIDPATMKKAIKVRKQKLEEMENKESGNTRAATNSTGNKLKDAKKAAVEFDDPEDGDPF